MATPKHTTELLLKLDSGDGAAADRLTPLVYDELHAVAERFMARERSNHTLQPTALVNEAYLNLIDQTRVDWKNRAQFSAVAANIMRRLLVDHARRHNAIKHGGDAQKLVLTDSLRADTAGDIDVLALDEALEELNRLNERHRKVVELRFFGALTVDETAHALGVSPQTVRTDWYSARAWLRVRLSE